MAAVLAVQARAGESLYARIGAFLDEQRLAPEPANYAFAYRVIAEPRGALATAVARLVDGGVRLTRSDIDALGATVGAAAAPAEAAEPPPPAEDPQQAMVAAAATQLDTLNDLVISLSAATAGFGRDLADSAGRIRAEAGEASIDELLVLIQAMVDRVEVAENSLEVAKHEAEDLRQRLREAQDTARRDPLTDLPNRRAFEEAFAVRAGAGLPISVAIVDVDKFKSINDRFGHGVGDRVLKAIAAGLAKTCSEHFVARLGGEEFGVLFSGCSPDAALALLEDAREQAAERRFRLRETDSPIGSVTFSAGIVARDGNEALGPCLGRADALLYRAKAEGRNRVLSGPRA